MSDTYHTTAAELLPDGRYFVAMYTRVGHQVYVRCLTYDADGNETIETEINMRVKLRSERAKQQRQNRKGRRS